MITRKYRQRKNKKGPNSFNERFAEHCEELQTLQIALKTAQDRITALESKIANLPQPVPIQPHWPPHYPAYPYWQWPYDGGWYSSGGSSTTTSIVLSPGGTVGQP